VKALSNNRRFLVETMDENGRQLMRLRAAAGVFQFDLVVVTAAHH
jgi:hypothetical protein